MKIIAFYLPQFHSFPENDKWWGKNFTEWTNTKKSVPQFEGHYQPREPQNDYYYNLLEPEAMKWQIDLAKEYGVYGFCFYHYWFKDGKKLMEKPIENFLQDKSLDQKFCLCWANEPWTRAWDGGTRDVIMQQEYGEKNEWEKHFEYLFDFFNDSRYISVNGKPLLVIYRPEIIPCLDEMLEFWNQLAIAKGLPGICYMAQGTTFNSDTKVNKSKFEYSIMYEPGYTQAQFTVRNGAGYLIKEFIRSPKLCFNVEWQKLKMVVSNKLKVKKNSMKMNILDYDLFWKEILNRKVPENNMMPGAFVDWDNSARRGCNGSRVFVNASPQKFGQYMSKLIRKTRDEYKKDMIFITAWNEWAEGAYLEPDKKYGSQYLEAIKDALVENNEFPEK